MNMSTEPSMEQLKQRAKKYIAAVAVSSSNDTILELNDILQNQNKPQEMRANAMLQMVISLLEFSDAADKLAQAQNNHIRHYSNRPAFAEPRRASPGQWNHERIAYAAAAEHYEITKETLINTFADSVDKGNGRFARVVLSDEGTAVTDLLEAPIKNGAKIEADGSIGKKEKKSLQTRHKMFNNSILAQQGWSPS